MAREVPRPRGGALEWIRRMPRPTRATSLLLTITAMLELVGQLIASKGVAIAAAAAVGAVISDAFLAPQVTFAELDRRTPLRMAVGVPAMVEVRVSGAARRLSGRRPIVLEDRAPGLDVGRYVIPSIRAGERATAERAAMPHHRGCWPDGGRIDIEAFSPLGGWVRRDRVRIAESGWVHPAPAVPLRLPEANTGEVYGRASISRSGIGQDFYGIREWRAGDPASSVHWRASARRNELVVMERERPGHPTLTVVVGRIADDEAAEDLLARLASTAVQALRDGRDVVLVADAAVEKVTKPLEALDWFAALDPMGEPDPGALRTAMQMAGAGATVVWFGSDTVPSSVVGAARAAGAGSIASAQAMAVPGR